MSSSQGVVLGARAPGRSAVRRRRGRRPPSGPPRRAWIFGSYLLRSPAGPVASDRFSVDGRLSDHFDRHQRDVCLIRARAASERVPCGRSRGRDAARPGPGIPIARRGAYAGGDGRVTAGTRSSAGVPVGGHGARTRQPEGTIRLDDPRQESADLVGGSGY